MDSKYVRDYETSFLYKMNTPLKTNMGTRKIFQCFWRRLIVMCVNHSFFIYAVMGIMFLLLYSSVSSDKVTTLSQIKLKYPSQRDIFWMSFESGVNDVYLFNRPSTLLLLYQPQSETLLDNILKDLSVYLSKKLGAETPDPIILDHTELNVPPFSEDYGEVISHFGDQLKTRHVMILKNVDQVYGKVAQAFHVLCDEYSPYVNKALIIFTLKVNNFPEDDNLFVEDLLRKSWSDVDQDTFDSLATRMLGMILRVNDSKYNLSKDMAIIKSLQLVIPLIFLCLLILFYHMTHHYRDIAMLCHNYPRYKDCIWENLYSVSICDQFFMLSYNPYFLRDLVNYLQRKLGLQSFVTLGEKDMKDIQGYLKQNKDKLENGCILVIDNIEVIQEVLWKLFRCNKIVRTTLKKCKFPIIYIVRDEMDQQGSCWDEKFIELLPPVKVLKV